jgi:hypothetical protein
MSAHKRSLKD